VVFPSCSARKRATVLGIGAALALVALVGATAAAAHPNVIDFRRTCSGHRADGHNHADTIYGSRICRNTPDIFRGLFGDDRIFGYLGDDTLLKGSRGDDLVSGGPGNDHVEGSQGNDVLRGGTGKDHIEGGEGNDVIRGGPGDDVIDCGDGDDRAWGGSGHDTLVNCEGPSPSLHLPAL
jgi:hypothetical protein